MGLKILGTGRYLPSKVVTNDDLAKTVETSDEWIRERTGIGSRHISSPEETVSYMGTEAAKKAMEKAGISAEDIELVILATCTAEYNTPTSSSIVQANLGAMNAATYDVNAGCTGFMTALTIADAYAKAGIYKNMLLVGAEQISSILDWNDRTTCILFGDGAGAMVLQADSEADTHFSLRADGSKADKIVGLKKDALSMDGKAVYRFATTKVPEIITETLEKAGKSADDIDYFVLHQANRRIIETISKNMKIDINKFPMNMEHTGNISAASIPVIIDEENEKGTFKPGMKLLMAGFGAGLTYGSYYLTW